MVQALLLGKYHAHALKGLIAGSDRKAAVEAMMEAVGGKVNSIQFTRGAYDVVVEVSAPTHDALMGVTTALKASGAFESADYLEYVNIETISEQAKKVGAAYKPAG
jgi:uncharacterized protein with GYD domain